MSLGTGRPIVLRDESSIRHCRLLFTHRMASPTDVRLISQVELMAQKSAISTYLLIRIILLTSVLFALSTTVTTKSKFSDVAAQIYETLSPLNGAVNHNTLGYIRRANAALGKWYTDHDELHGNAPFL